MGAALPKEVVDVVAILAEYIEIHNSVFKFSFKKFIPIPGFFQPIDYPGHVTKLEGLVIRLQKILPTGDIQPESFEEYTSALLAAIEHLRDICWKMKTKIQTGAPYPWAMHNQDVSYYHSLASRCQSLGKALNQKFK